MASIKLIEENSFESKKIKNLNVYEENTISGSNCVKIIFTSPLKLDELKIEKLLNGFANCHIKYQIGNKPKFIGGFDMLRSKAKKMEIMLDEGTVWIIENEKFKDKSLKVIRSLIENQFENLISENYKGFGCFLISEFKGVD